MMQHQHQGLSVGRRSTTDMNHRQPGHGCWWVLRLASPMGLPLWALAGATHHHSNL